MSHARTRLLGDNLVNHALSSKVNRESQYLRKQSVTVRAEDDYERAMRMNTVGGERPMFGNLWDRQETEFNEDIRQDIKTACRIRRNEKHLDHINTLVKQGELFKLADSERGDVIWKSYIYDMKKGVMKFCLN